MKENRRKLVQGIVVVAVLLLCLGGVWWGFGRGSEQGSGPAAPGSGAAAPALAAGSGASQAPAAAPSTSAAAEARATSEPSDAGSGSGASRGGSYASGDSSRLVEPSNAAGQPTPAAAPVETAQPTATAVASAAPPDAGTDAGASAPPTAVAAATPPLDVTPPGGAVGRFQDRVGSTYRLTNVTCLVDGNVTYQGAAGSAGLFDLHLSPGNHVVSVVADYDGAGQGVFSYLNGYHFKVRAGRPFQVRSNETTRVSVTAFERAATVKYEDRLTLALDVR